MNAVPMMRDVHNAKPLRYACMWRTSHRHTVLVKIQCKYEVTAAGLDEGSASSLMTEYIAKSMRTLASAM